VRDNVIAMLCGLICYDQFAASLGCPLDGIAMDRAIMAVLAEVLEESGAVKSAADHFLEQLSAATIHGNVMSARHYLRDGPTLFLHFQSCHAAFREHCRRTAWTGEVLDEKALRRQLREEKERDGYVIDLSRQVSFQSPRDRRRCIVIDVEKASRHLDIDGFRDTGAGAPP
ncbi:MAG: DNA primase, partial [Myxococcales bacterium]|nr:DNA primase [Myxococcales bacterium]